MLEINTLLDLVLLIAHNCLTMKISSNKNSGSIKAFLVLLLTVILVQFMAGFDILTGLKLLWQLIIEAILSVGDQFYNLFERWS